MLVCVDGISAKGSAKTGSVVCACLLSVQIILGDSYPRSES